ncbi:unnamed protein product [Microthlaspi erraticum]|uniref:Protein kinase domain-containing protein n=1 Tax=Microthlaspi erraticum TaxID=1685480 RepID=A0A6D2KGW1_9BRAS|nr:unnamed protein product [Microthlaspi erraticum]
MKRCVFVIEFLWLRELYAATKGFHSTRVIGRGAFGKNVYRAISHVCAIDHCLLAAQESCRVGVRRRENCFSSMSSCLMEILYQESEAGAVSLDWSHSHRVNVAIGLASALSYLHHECEQQVVHRDIKTSNIMLDINSNARL